MEVVAINSSPKMDKGNTDMLLAPFIAGIKEAGAEVEIFYTKKLKINPCQGEFDCWLKSPGQCFQQDDMQMLIPKLSNAGIWVLATPLYVDGMSGPMKNFVDRCIPIMQPFFELRDGHCRHPLREGVKRGRVALVSSCGFWELDNFDPLLVHIKALCRNVNREFAGALLRPHGGGLREMRGRGVPLDDIFDAAKEAGRQLINNGEMSATTLSIISRNLLPLERHMQTANQFFQRRIDSLEEK